eukprot:s738_g32.t1
MVLLIYLLGILFANGEYIYTPQAPEATTRYCAKDVKAVFSNCGFCGAHWQECTPQTHRQQQTKSPRRQQGAWTYTGQWDKGVNRTPPNAWDNRTGPTKSPRRHTKKSPARPNRPRSARSKRQQEVPPEEPAWEPDSDGGADSTGTDPATAAAQSQLRELVVAVQQMDQPLTSDVQKALVNAQKIAKVDPAKQLQSATSRLTHARDQLRKAREARLSMHNSWAKFIADALKRWNKHTEDFEARDAEHQSAIQIAMDKYKTAKQIVETSKEAVDAHDGRAHEDGQDINDDELMADDTPSIKEDLKTMVQHFERIRARQAESLDGSATKKPRVEEITSDGDDLKEAGQPPVASAVAFCTAQWLHPILQDDGFRSPWAAIEIAVDQSIEVHGFDVSSRLLNGFDGLHGRSLQVHYKQKNVTFASSVELLYGSEDDILSPTILTQSQFDAWYDKPWALRAVDPLPVVEPQSEMAVLIPTGCTRTVVTQKATQHPDSSQAASSSSSLTAYERSVLHHMPAPTDHAIYDMDRAWLHHLQVDWREHAVAEPGEDGRVLNVRSWYIHHQTRPRCFQPRLIKLDYMDHLWLSDLRALWSDQIQSGEVLHLVAVRPNPPQADHQPYEVNVILSQGIVPDRIGVIITARFIQDHQTHLFQEAVSSPAWMCGTRAVDLLRINHLLQNKRWIARCGILMFATDELEQISDGISIVIDIRSQLDDTGPDDVTSLAAWTHTLHPAQPAVTDMAPAARPADDVDIESSSDPSEGALSDGSTFGNADDTAIDWRFVHLHRTQRRIYHGHLPWNDADLFHQQVAEWTTVAERDIVHVHHVRHAPADLHAARIVPLIFHSVADLPLGSVLRLVLVDVEFHEHPEAHDVSTSRRCLALPAQLARRTLLRLLGISTYCERVRQRCLVWHNHAPVLTQFHGHVRLSHGDYVRVAIPPLPHVPDQVSTRVCVSRARRHLPRTAPVQVPDRHHEDGMSEVDNLERNRYGHFVHDRDFDDQSALFQADPPQLFRLPSTPSSLLASDVLSGLLQVSPELDHSTPVDKIEDEPLDRLQAARLHDQRVRHTPPLADQPPIVRELYDVFHRHMVDHPDLQDRPRFVDTWYSDHQRRPHSGIGRMVRLDEDFNTWLTAIIFAWEDWVDPFHSLTCHIVAPDPDGRDPEAIATVVLVQNAIEHHFSTMVSIYDTQDDPWHPRLMCLMVPRWHVHQALVRLVDLDGTSLWCRSWFGEAEITTLPEVALFHGASLLFSMHRRLPHDVSAAAPDDEGDEGNENAATMLLQTKASLRPALRLDQLVAPPVWVQVDCQKALFLRTQLHTWTPFCPSFDLHSVTWHASTRVWLDSIPAWQHEHPRGFSFYTDGSFNNKLTAATAAVMLIVATDDGLRWGGYVTAQCLGVPTAPRAEATALLLTTRWICHLLHAGASPEWVEFAFDCESIAGIAQGRLGTTSNPDLIYVLRALLHWLEPRCGAGFTWTHLRSHQGHPGNEAADSLCRHALKSPATVNDLHEFHQQCTFDGTDLVTIQWLWLLEQSILGDHGAPLLDKSTWKFNIAAPLTTPPVLDLQPWAWRHGAHQECPRETVQIKLQLGTANVLTLFPGQDYASHFISARMESLAQQFHEGGLHIVGLQETRSKMEGHFALDSFHVLSAAATQRGAGGIQLWVRKHIRCGDVHLHVETSDLYILHASAQRLIVRFACSGLRMIFVVVHAPVVDEEEVLRKFWQATSHAIPAKYASWSLFLLADANSRLGSTLSQAVGAHHATDENVKGQCFHEWLLHHSLYLPQTFPDCHIGIGHTWAHATGATARLDYIGCPMELPGDQVSTWIDEDIDLAIHRDDHACVRAAVELCFHRTARRTSAPAVPPQPATPTAWNTDVHTHAAVLQAQIRAWQSHIPCRRKPHLSTETFQMILAKRYHRKKLLQLHRHQRLAIMRQIFSCWRQRQSCPVVSRWLACCDQQAAWHLSVIWDLSPRVVAAVRADDAAFYEDLAAKAGRESFRGSRQLWAAIKHVLPRWRNKQRSNLRCTGPSVEDKFAHYNHLEAGESVSYEQLLHSCWNVQQRSMHEAPLSMDLHSLPTRCHVECLLARLKRDKAPGLDTISSNVLRDHGLWFSADIVKLFLKMWTTSAEPLQFKGGLVHTIGKKKKSTSIKDMRGIALLDGLGKLSHAVLRSQFIPFVNAARAPLQLGGFAHQSTLFASHYLRAFSHLADARGLSSAVIFLDIRSAFHSLLRSLVFQTEAELPARLREVLLAQGSDLAAIEQRHVLCSNHHMPQVLARLLKDAHDHTWYTVASSDEVQRTHRGRRPGSPLADAAYNALMTQFIADIQDEVAANPAMQQAYMALGLTPLLVAWVDDIAIPIVDLQASQLTQSVLWVLEAVMRIGRSYGLVLNLQPTKTEVVVAFRGVGAVDSRASCYQECQGQLYSEKEDCVLRCVSAYEHLGALYTPDGAIARELSHRLSRAQAAYQQVRRPILGNRHLAVRTRLRLLDALVVPVLLHGAGCWPLLTHQQLTKMQGVYIRWVRAIVQNGCWTADMTPDHLLMMQWNLPNLPLRLAKMRLLYAFHLVADGPRLLLEFVTATEAHERSWVPALRHALIWLRRLDPTVMSWDPGAVNVEIIVEWLANHAQTGPRLVHKCFRLALQQGHVVARAVTLHEQLHRCLRQGGCFFTTPSAPSASASAAYECRLCAHSFGSLHRLQVHQWLAHELLSDERALMTSTVCGACHTCFWTSQRLQQHLRYSRRHHDGCYAQLTWRCAPSMAARDLDSPETAPSFFRQPATPVAHVPAQVEVELATRDAADRLLEHHWRLAGLPDDLDPVIADLAFERYDACVRTWTPPSIEAIDALVFDLTGIVDEIEHAGSCPHQGEWALCVWILDHFRCARFAHISGELFPHLDQALRAVLLHSSLGKLLCWKRRMDEAYQPVMMAVNEEIMRPVPRSLEPIDDPCAMQQMFLSSLFDEPITCPPCNGVPLCLEGDKPVVWLLHLYSGRRRVGDCHWWLEHIGRHVFPAFPVRLVSVDTAIDEINGNLASGSNLQLILALARKGAFSAVLTGPPCETWSAARGLDLDDCVGPRILRTAATPWCIPGLTAKEMRQSEVGAELLLNSLQVETTAVCAGAGALMEHPWEPDAPEKASTWRLRCHDSWCMKLRDAHRHRIEQWVYGAVGVKPTCLRALNLGPPEVVDRALKAGAELWRSRPAQGLRGRGVDGKFRTSGHPFPCFT